MATMPPIELDSIAHQKPSHDCCDRCKTGTHQNVHMVGYHRPCKTICMRFNQHLAEPVYKGVAISIVPKDFSAFDSTHNDVVKRTRSINSGFLWHTKYKKQAKLIMSINKSIPVPQPPDQLRQKMGTWAEHAASWVDATGIDVHIMRYEDMKAKTVETFFKTIEFIGLKRTQEDVEKALELSDMNKLKKYEQEDGFREKPANAKSFFRKGKTGDWEDHLTQDQVKSIIHINGDVMKKFGYLD